MKFIKYSYNIGILPNASCAQVWKIDIDKILKEFKKFTKLFNKPKDDDALSK